MGIRLLNFMGKLHTCAVVLCVVVALPMFGSGGDDFRNDNEDRRTRKIDKAKRIYGKANDMWDAAHYDSARIYFLDAAVRFHKLGLTKEQFESRYYLGRMMLGRMWHDLSLADSTRDYILDAIDIAKSISPPDKKLLEKAEMSLYHYYVDTRQIPKAVSYLLSFRPDEDPKRRSGFAYYRLASKFADESAELDSSNHYFFKSLSEFRRFQEVDVTCKRKVPQALKRLGANYRQMMYYDEAEYFLQEGIRFCHENLKGDPKYHHRAGEIYVVLANLYDHLGDEYRAIEYHQKALTIWDEVGGNLGEQYTGLCHANLSAVYTQLQETELAYKHLRKARDIFQQLETNYNYVRTYRTEAHLLEAAGQYREAVRRMQELLPLFTRRLGAEHPETMFAQLGTARLFHKDRNNSRALEMLIEMERTAKSNRSKFRLLLPSLYETFGDVYSAEGDLELALDYYQRAIIARVPGFDYRNYRMNPDGRLAYNKRRLLRPLVGKARVLRVRYHESSRDIADLTLSLETLRLAMNLFGEIRRDYHVQSKYAFSQESFDLVPEAIETATELYRQTDDKQYLRLAFAFSEQLKSVTLRETLSDAAAKNFGGIHRYKLQQEKELKADLAYCELRISEMKFASDPASVIKLRQLQDQYFDLRRRYDEMIASFETDYPRYYQLKYQNRTTSIDEIQSLLDEETALVNYLVGASKIYIFVISKNDFVVRTQRIESDFKNVVNQFYVQLKKLTESHAMLKSGKQLHNILINPIRDAIEDKAKLVIIPDAGLTYVPCEALVETSFQSKQRRILFEKVPFLIHKHEIRYHYSANLFVDAAKKRQIPTIQRENMLALAPVFSKEEGNGVLASLDEHLARMLNLDELIGTIDSERSSFVELPHSKTEVQRIVNAWNKDDRRATGYLGSDATETNFKNDVQSYKYIHIASHSFMHQDNPRLSGIAFSQLTRQPTPDDGILYTSEIYNLSMNADLVTLSSCESGVGKLIKGEGMMAMTRGFLTAGAKNVVVSLWRVRDRHTTDLMIRFYDEILKNKSYGEALRNAKLALLRNPVTAHPNSWSTFVLVGQ